MVLENFGEYIYKVGDLTKLYNQFNELKYLCDNFDMNRINNFLINIIENYDFYIEDDNNDEFSNGYSNIRDSDKLSGDILAADEYNNMISEMNKNFDKINTKYGKFVDEINKFNDSYLEYVKNPKNYDMDILENIKNEYKIVISNLEELQQRFSEIEKKNIIADTIYGIKIDVILITNNSIVYNTIGYSIYKKFLYRNLHVINRETFYVTNSDIEEFKNKLYKIYSKIHKDFIIKFNSGNAKLFDKELLTDLKDKIKKLRENSKLAEDTAEKIFKEKKSKEEEEKAEIIENLDSEYINAVTNAKLKETEADKAKQEYDSKKKVVDKLKDSIAELEGTSILPIVGSILGNPSDKAEAGKTDEEGDAEDDEEDSKVEAVKAEIGDNKANAVKAEIGDNKANAVKAEIGDNKANAVKAEAVKTEAVKAEAVKTEAVKAEYIEDKKDKAIETNTKEIITSVPVETVQTSTIVQTSAIPQNNSQKEKISTNGEQGNIPQKFWDMIIKTERPNSQRWKKIIKKWNKKSDKELADKKRWDEQRSQNPNIHIKEEEEFLKKEKENEEYWDEQVWMETVGTNNNIYTNQYEVDKARIKYFNEIPFIKSWAKEKWDPSYKQDRQRIIDAVGERRNASTEKRVELGKAAREAYYKEFGVKIGDNPIYKNIKNEFLDDDEYFYNILTLEQNKKLSDDVNIRRENDEYLRTTKIPSFRRRFYLTKEELNFHNKYFDVFNSYSNMRNKFIIELPEPSDGTKASINDIESFKRVDRFLAKLYNDRRKNMEGGDPDKNIIIFIVNDLNIYNKYISYFTKNYPDLIPGENLIFKGSTYELKKKSEI